MLTQEMTQTMETVYGGRPDFYRNIACSLASTQVVAYGATQKYMVGTIACSNPF